MFEKHRKLVFHCYKRLDTQTLSETTFISQDDLIQVGFIGLWKAIEKFDESLGFKFSTYAVPKITGEMLKEIRDNNGLVKVSRHVKSTAKKIRKEIQKGAKMPTVEEIMETYEVSKKRAIATLDFMDLKVYSLSGIVKSDYGKDIHLEETIEDEYINFQENIVENDFLNKALELLDEREKFIVAYSIHEVPQKEIGKLIGLSQVHVGRIYKKALQKMRDYYEVSENENELQFA